MRWFWPSARQHLLCSGETGFPIGEAVEPPIDLARDALNVVGVGGDVDLPPSPIGTCDASRDYGICGKVRLNLQRKLKRGPDACVIRSPGKLENAPSAVEMPISGPDVSKVGAALISKLLGGRSPYLLEEPETLRFVARLGNEVGEAEVCINVYSRAVLIEPVRHTRADVARVPLCNVIEEALGVQWNPPRSAALKRRRSSYEIERRGGVDRK